MSVNDDDQLVAPKALPPLGTLVQRFVLLRDKIKEVEKLQKEVLIDPKKLLETLNSQIVSTLKEMETDSSTTPNGLAYLTDKNSATIQDVEAFSRFVIGGEKWDLIDWKANVTVVEDFIKENDGELPPGIKWNSFTKAGVRKPTIAKLAANKRKAVLKAVVADDDEDDSNEDEE